MKAYPDTTFLCAIYRTQGNSDRAVAYRKSMAEPLHVSRLLVWEFRQAARFQAFRHSKNRELGYPLREAEKMLSDLADDMRDGFVVSVDCDFYEILTLGERISKIRTFAGGHRSLDIMHVATALVLDAREFLSFDGNQVRLAVAEGLVVPDVLG